MPSARFDPGVIVFKDRYRRLNRSESDVLLAEIQAKFASFLNKKQRTSAEQTYRGFKLGDSAIEQCRSAKQWLKPWMEADGSVD